MSQYPLHQSAHNEFIWVEFAPDEVAAMSNVHLCHEPYGPYDIRDGLNAAAAAENEN